MKLKLLQHLKAFRIRKNQWNLPFLMCKIFPTIFQSKAKLWHIVEIAMVLIFRKIRKFVPFWTFFLCQRRCTRQVTTLKINTAFLDIQALPLLMIFRRKMFVSVIPKISLRKPFIFVHFFWKNFKNCWSHRSHPKKIKKLNPSLFRLMQSWFLQWFWRTHVTICSGLLRPRCML